MYLWLGDVSWFKDVMAQRWNGREMSVGSKIWLRDGMAQRCHFGREMSVWPGDVSWPGDGMAGRCHFGREMSVWPGDGTFHTTFMIRNKVNPFWFYMDIHELVIICSIK